MNKATKNYLTLFAILIVTVFVGTVMFANKERFATPPPPTMTVVAPQQQVLPNAFVQQVLQNPQVPVGLKQQLQGLSSVPAQFQQQAAMPILVQLVNTPGVPVQLVQQAAQLQQQIIQQLNQQGQQLNMQQNPQQNPQLNMQQNLQGRCGPMYQQQKCPPTQCCSDIGICGGKKGTASDSCKFDVPVKSGAFGGSYDG